MAGARFRTTSPAFLWLLLRALGWMVLLPGFFAGYVPWRYFGLRAAALDLHSPVSRAGFLLVAVGVALLLACVWEFARSGRGTLSPAEPPRELVAVGLYRYVRNPMYLSVTTILLGQSLAIRSAALLAYAACYFAGVHLFVIGCEEPWLRRRFGASYQRYCAAAGRWLPSLRRPQAPPPG